MSGEQNDLFDPMGCDVTQLLDHAGAGEALAERANWPKLLAELVDVCAAAFRRDGRAEAAALADAETTVLAIAEYFGGRMLYLPRNDALRKALRDALIWHTFKGDNIAALAEQHRLTPQAIYQIIAEQKRLRTRKLQGRLFD